jgi:hypothetical protein
MGKILLVIAVSILFVYSLGHAGGYADFEQAVSKKVDEVGRPEIVVQSDSFIIVIFGLDTAMEKFKYNKQTKEYRVKEIRKFEDSTDEEITTVN